MTQPLSGTENRPKSRLGRGLSSLMAATDLPVVASAPPPPTAAAAPPDIISELPVDQITVNPNQPRRHFDEAKLAELAASIRANGLIQPIVVRKVVDGYQLIAGERRWRASKLAGLQTIAVHIAAADEWSQSQWALVENIHRSDLNPIERADAYHNLMRLGNLTQQQLAEKIGEDRSSIANHLRLLELNSDVIGMLRDGDLSLGHAKVLAVVQDGDLQSKLANKVVNEGLSVRALETLLDEMKPSDLAVTAPALAKNAHIADLEQRLSRELGLKVQVRSSGKGKGKITIRYGSLEQFDELMERMRIALDE